MSARRIRHRSLDGASRHGAHGEYGFQWWSASIRLRTTNRLLMIHFPHLHMSLLILFQLYQSLSHQEKFFA